MRNDFCVLILTHGRPDKQTTLKTLARYGYTGPVYLVLDDEDATADEYRRLHGDKVVTFSKREAVAITDECDNFPGRRGVVYARNAAFGVARSLGFRYFVALDDDYHWFYYRFDCEGRYGMLKVKSLDWLFSALVDYLAATPFVSVALSQGGDHIGGGASGINKTIRGLRKAMNSFVCDVERPFRFTGRINEDVNAYTAEQRAGAPFLTFMQAQLWQDATQTNPGGLTEIYLDVGTYVKSFYSVIACPSAVKVGTMGDPAGGLGRRLHHKINTNACAPCIIREEYRLKDGEVRAPAPPRNTPRKAAITEQRAAEGLQWFEALMRKVGIARASEIARMAGDAIQWAKKNKSQPPALHHLFSRWYAPLRNGGGAPDYGVYAEDDYLAEVWLCWFNYSRAAIGLLPQHLPKLAPASVVDLGNGLGVSTVALKQAFPSARVIGTNLRDTTQWKTNEHLAERYGYEFVGGVGEISGGADLVFASEYFEHFHDPLPHLRDVLSTLRPRALLIANAFNVDSIGHFDTYHHNGGMVSGADMSKLFNAEMRRHGYEVERTKYWNQRPAYWVRNA
ncbi:MAG: hypothetical protein NW206_20050 [Hyphomonadaceae bacterium]|nr:hypothetical protein [Hyphomonadaceae bacterium]